MINRMIAYQLQKKVGSFFQSKNRVTFFLLALCTIKGLFPMEMEVECTKRSKQLPQCSTIWWELNKKHNFFALWVVYKIHFAKTLKRVCTCNCEQILYIPWAHLSHAVCLQGIRTKASVNFLYLLYTLTVVTFQLLNCNEKKGFFKIAQNWSKNNQFFLCVITDFFGIGILQSVVD